MILMHHDSFLDNGNYLCSWGTNGIETTINEWIDHVYHHHPPKWNRILDAQREKKKTTQGNDYDRPNRQKP